MSVFLYILYILVCAVLIASVCLQKAVGHERNKGAIKLKRMGFDKLLFHTTWISAVICGAFTIVMIFFRV